MTKVKYTGQPRNKLLKARYGISVPQWNKLFARQSGLCAICEKHIFKPGNRKATACVDHDHKTGRVRGLLCNWCNKKRVSNLTVELTERILEYLKSSFDGRLL